MIEEKSSFPSLDELADDFYKNNKLLLRIPSSKIETHGGLLIRFGLGGLVLLSTSNSKSMEENVLHPCVDGRDSHKYSLKEKAYILSGKLNYRPIYLETIITETQDYLMEEIKDINYTDKLPIKEGKPSLKIIRKDDFPYWFITPHK